MRYFFSTINLTHPHINIVPHETTKNKVTYSELNEEKRYTPPPKHIKRLVIFANAKQYDTIDY